MKKSRKAIFLLVVGLFGLFLTSCGQKEEWMPLPISLGEKEKVTDAVTDLDWKDYNIESVETTDSTLSISFAGEEPAYEDQDLETLTKNALTSFVLFSDLKDVDYLYENSFYGVDKELADTVFSVNLSHPVDYYRENREQFQEFQNIMENYEVVKDVKQ